VEHVLKHCPLATALAARASCKLCEAVAGEALSYLVAREPLNEHLPGCSVVQKAVVLSDVSQIIGHLADMAARYPTARHPAPTSLILSSVHHATPSGVWYGTTPLTAGVHASRSWLVGVMCVARWNRELPRGVTTELLQSAWFTMVQFPPHVPHFTDINALLLIAAESRDDSIRLTTNAIYQLDVVLGGMQTDELSEEVVWRVHVVLLDCLICRMDAQWSPSLLSHCFNALLKSSGMYDYDVHEARWRRVAEYQSGAIADIITRAAVSFPASCFAARVSLDVARRLPSPLKRSLLATAFDWATRVRSSFCGEVAISLLHREVMDEQGHTLADAVRMAARWKDPPGGEASIDRLVTLMAAGAEHPAIQKAGAAALAALTSYSRFTTHLQTVGLPAAAAAATATADLDTLTDLARLVCGLPLDHSAGLEPALHQLVRANVDWTAFGNPFVLRALVHVAERGHASAIVSAGGVQRVAAIMMLSGGVHANHNAVRMCERILRILSHSELDECRDAVKRVAVLSQTLRACSSELCKCGCGRPVAPGVHNARPGRLFDTCCRECACSSMRHDLWSHSKECNERASALAASDANAAPCI
jgi:hypothetical protein